MRFLERLWLVELITAAGLGVVALVWHLRTRTTEHSRMLDLALFLFVSLLVAAIASFAGGIFDSWFGTSPTCTVFGTILAILTGIQVSLRGTIRRE